MKNEIYIVLLIIILIGFLANFKKHEFSSESDFNCEISDCIYNLSSHRLPFLHKIKCGLKDGMYLNLTGRFVSESPSHFVFYKDDVQKELLRIEINNNNTFRSNKQPQAESSFSFHTTNKTINMKIGIEKDQYKLYVDDKHLADLKHELSAHQTISFLKIVGINVASICFVR